MGGVSQQAFEGGLLCACLAGPPPDGQILLHVVPGSMVTLAAYPFSQNSSGASAPTSTGRAPASAGRAPAQGLPRGCHGAAVSRLCSKPSGWDMPATGQGISSRHLLSPRAAPTMPPAPLRARRTRAPSPEGASPHFASSRPLEPGPAPCGLPPSSPADGQCLWPDSGAFYLPIPQTLCDAVRGSFFDVSFGLSTEFYHRSSPRPVLFQRSHSGNSCGQGQRRGRLRHTRRGQLAGRQGRGTGGGDRRG